MIIKIQSKLYSYINRHRLEKNNQKRTDTLKQNKGEQYVRPW